MASSLSRSLARLSRWPRRIAALGCLLLAGASAITPRSADPARAAPRPPSVGDSLRPGEVAVPVPVTSSPSIGFVRRGDRIGFVAGPSDASTAAASGLIADRLRVLAVSAQDDAGARSTSVVVAASRADAVRLGAIGERPVLVVVDDSS